MPHGPMLWLLVVFLVTPWIYAETVNDVNVTVAPSTSSYVDDTRREDPRLHSIDLNTATLPTEKEDANQTKKLIARSFDLSTEVLTGFETEVPCDNAQFLLKILTVMLPLLRDEVPESTRTSYILYALKDLLKTSPEAAQDYEIMYKINDLFVTLDKYHERDGHDFTGPTALRQFDTAPTIPGSVRSKIVFKYEVPQLPNPDCTAELLTIIKIVQDAILRLVNNPLCKSHVPVDMPILADVNNYFANPKLNSNEPIPNLPYLPDAKKSPILDIDVLSVLDKKPFYPYVSDANPNYYDKSPFHQKQPLYPISPTDDPFYIYPQYPNDKNPINPPYSYDASPSISSFINDAINKPEYNQFGPEQSNLRPYIIGQPHSSTPSGIEIKLPTIEHKIIDKTPKMHFVDYLPKYEDISINPKKLPKKRPEYVNDQHYPNPDQLFPIKYELPYNEFGQYPPNPSYLPLDVSEDNSGKDQIDYSRLNPVDYQNQQEVEPYRPNSIYEYDLRPSSRPPHLDIYGNDDSAEIQIGPYGPKRPNNQLKTSSFDIYGLPDSADIPINQYPYNPYLYITPPKQKPKKNPNKYDTSPQKLPTEKGIPDFSNNGLKPPFNPYSPKHSSNRSPNRSSLYHPYFPNTNYKPPYKPFDVSGEGSDEIQLRPIESQNDFYSLNKPKTKPEYPNDYDQALFPPYEKESPNTLPEHYWPETEHEDLHYVTTDIPDSIDTYSSDESIIISGPTTKRPSQQVFEDHYLTPEIHETPQYKDLYPEYDISQNNKLNIWNFNTVPSKISPHLVPDNKILLIIKDNIDVMEQKIPKEHLNPEIREIVKHLRDLLDLQKITIEEYVDILNQYQILIEYLKHMNISNAIMKELLLSMTNLDKLDLQTGKSQVIELTYLIKRPKPMIYQPYYYIKYRLPYASFLARIERLLRVEPYLKNNPAKLYKALISISKLVETSPELEKYGKEDILKLTFDKGTLVGAKVTKGTDVKMYNTLDRLKNINSDFTVDDIYELIKNLDAQLRRTPEGLVLKNSNIPGLNINPKPEIRIIKVKNQPIIQKITKITTKKVADDKILADILHGANILRSNNSEPQSEEESNQPLINDTKKTNDTRHFIGRSRDTYHENQLNNNIPLITYEPINHNIDDYANVFSNLKYTANNAAKSYKLLPNNIEADLDNNQADWLGETINAYSKKPKSYNWKSVDLDSISFKSGDPYLADDSTFADYGIPAKQLHPITKAKLLGAPLKENNNDKLDNYKSQQYYVKSAPQQVSLSTSDINDSLNTVKSLVKHSKTYINGIPVKHSKSYLIEKPNGVQQLDTSYRDPVNYNVQNSQSFIEYNPYVANYNYNNNPRQSQDPNQAKQLKNSNVDSSLYKAVNSKTLMNKNFHSDLDNNYNLDYNSSQSQDVIAQQSQTYGNENNLAQNQAHIRGNRYDSTNDLAKNRVYNSGNSYNGTSNLAHNVAYITGNQYDNSNNLAQNQAYVSGNPYDSTNDLAHNQAIHSGNSYTSNLVQSQDYMSGNPYDRINNLANNQPYVSENGGNTYGNTNFNKANNAVSYDLYTQNRIANNMINPGYGYRIHQRWPALYRLSRRPRLLRPFVG